MQDESLVSTRDHGELLRLRNGWGSLKTKTAAVFDYREWDAELVFIDENSQTSLQKKQTLCPTRRRNDTLSRNPEQPSFTLRRHRATHALETPHQNSGPRQKTREHDSDSENRTPSNSISSAVFSSHDSVYGCEECRIRTLSPARKDPRHAELERQQLRSSQTER